MPRSRFILVVLTLCAAVSVHGNSQRGGVHKGKAKPPAQQPKPAVTQQQQIQQSPQTPEQGPSSPPDVTFHGGQLTIVARNSTLGDVLNAVRAKTGAAVEMPPSSSERVVGQFGPGAPRDVMAQLLNGSHYDYVLLGSPGDPGALKKVVLSVRAIGPEPVQQTANSSPGYNPNAQGVPQGEVDQSQDQPTEDATSNDVQPEQPPQAEQEEPQGEQPPQANPGGPSVKTPEQLLRELQQQQQQQQNQPPQQ